MNIFGFLFIGLIILVIYYIIINKVKIKFKTFFKKGFKVSKGIFGIYCYCGFQGNGKTYSCVEYVYDNYDNIQLFSNIKLNLDNYIYYNGFKEMLNLRDAIDWALYKKNDYIIFKGKKYNIDFSKQITFIYDEIFSELQRGSRIDTDVLDFITQMRKRRFILLTTSQIWNDIPITFRRLTRYQIDCNMLNYFGLNVLIKTFHDAECMKWSNDLQEHIAPIISTTITHTRQCIANTYDTFELIHNKLSSFNSDNLTRLSEENDACSTLVEHFNENDIDNVSCETLSDKVDNEFWGKGETLTSLTGLRISDVNVNVKE